MPRGYPGQPGEFVAGLYGRSGRRRDGWAGKNLTLDRPPVSSAV